jgi:hypothetical protein
MLISSAALNLYFHEYGADSDTRTQLSVAEPFGLGLLLSLVLMGASSAAYRILQGRAFIHHRWQALPAILVFVVALLAAVAAVPLLMQPEQFHPTDGQIKMHIVASFLLLLAFSILTAISYPAAVSVEAGMARNATAVGGANRSSSSSSGDRDVGCPGAEVST